MDHKQIKEEIIKSGKDDSIYGDTVEFSTEAMSLALDRYAKAYARDFIPEEKDKCTHSYSQEDGYCHVCFRTRLDQTDHSKG